MYSQSLGPPDRYLYQDGTIGFEIKLTGILSTSMLSPGEAAPTHGTLVAPGVNAAQHQHLFSARLDLSVDDEQGGKQLVVSEVGLGPADAKSEATSWGLVP
jgi:primary-amine oxidase